MNEDYQDWHDGKVDATAVVCRNCYDTAYFEFDLPLLTDEERTQLVVKLQQT